MNDSVPSTSGFAIQSAPVFDTVEQERTHRLQRLAGVCRIFGRAGFSEGLLGHVTVRDPENDEHLWANPIGVSFNRMRVSDLVKADHHGNILVGERPVNPVGLLLHAAVHRARPEVEAVCHAHSVYGSAWSAFGEPLQPITQDTCVFHDDQAIITAPRIAKDDSEADQFAAAFGDKKCAIQIGHGLFTTGHSVDEAAWWFISMDKACQVQLLARAAGSPAQWPDAAALGVAKALGSPQFGWMSFQTLWDEIIASDPELLD
ncbi:MAG: class II aldolase/adducin family protein [Chromatiales bacterium]|jgi:ribulose-5-phosphate 4-epimerase/fuculose-1-phosphate aldolase|nr:class II aldolase/adducin family protein [Chromatiales bacterium]